MNNRIPQKKKMKRKWLKSQGERKAELLSGVLLVLGLQCLPSEAEQFTELRLAERNTWQKLG